MVKSVRWFSRKNDQGKKTQEVKTKRSILGGAVRYQQLASGMTKSDETTNYRKCQIRGGWLAGASGCRLRTELGGGSLPPREKNRVKRRVRYEKKGVSTGSERSQSGVMKMRVEGCLQ